jgi:hypothetical protein
MLEYAPIHIDESLDPQPWSVPLEMFAEASRNPVIAAKMREHEDASREQLRAMVKRGREQRQLPVDDVLLDGRLDTLISYFQGLTIRALYRPNMDRASLVDAFRIAMRALLMT